MTSPYLQRRLRSIEEAKAEVDRVAIAIDYERRDAEDERRREGAPERREAEAPRS